VILRLNVTAEQIEERVDRERVLVAQALLPVRVFQNVHSQEGLCHPTFSANCDDVTRNEFPWVTETLSNMKKSAMRSE
jgi:hypothetical protein